MYEKKKLPLNLQLFAEPEPQADLKNPQQTPPQPQAADTAVIAAAVLKAIEDREKRVGNSVVRSMAEQYGMKPEELTALLEKEKAAKAKALPPEVQAQLDKANEKLKQMALTAEARALGAAMGLLDTDTALLLMDQEKIKVDDSGAVTGMQEALDGLKTAKPFLFGTQQPAPQKGMAQRQGSSPGAEKTARDEMREMMFGK